MIDSFEIPEDICDRAADIARFKKISVAEVVTAACAEHVATWEQLEQRALRGDRARFLEVLSKVPDVEPQLADRFDHP